MSETRLYRSVQGRVIGGVAGGLADFFGMDPTIVRLIFVLLVIFGGSGVLLYVVLWIILPERNIYNTFNKFTPPVSTPGDASGIGETYDGFNQGKNYYADKEPITSTADVQQRKKVEGSLIGGVILIVIGSLFLIEKFIPRINFGDLWPVVLIAIGLILIFGSIPKGNKDTSDPAQPMDPKETQTF